MAALVVLLVFLLVVAAVMILRLNGYKAGHPHTAADLATAREDSRARSHSVVSGKVQEHLAPLFPDFLNQFNPRDARFLGTPIDFVVFDGLDKGEVQRVVFVEVKSGRSSLQTRERRVRDAIEAGRVEFQLLHLPTAIEAPNILDGVPIAALPDASLGLQPALRAPSRSPSQTWAS